MKEEEKGLFKLLFNREPKEEPDEPDFGRTVSALKKALEAWNNEPEEEEEDEAPRMI